MKMTTVRKIRWLLVGACVGAILVTAQWLKSPDDRTPPGRAMGPDGFASKLAERSGPPDMPPIRSMIVYPPAEIQGAVAGTQKGVQYVTGEVREKVSAGEYVYRPFTFHAPIPFEAAGIAVGRGDQYTVRDFIDELSTPDRGIAYQYAWWTTLPMTLVIWFGGSVLLIGGVWPALANLILQNSNDRNAESADAYDVSRFGNGQDASTNTDASTDLSNAAVDGILVPAHPAEGLEIKTEVDPPSTLSPPTPAENSVETPDPAHHYRGQFYPVELPTPRSSTP